MKTKKLKRVLCILYKNEAKSIFGILKRRKFKPYKLKELENTIYVYTHKTPYELANLLLDDDAIGDDTRLFINEVAFDGVSYLVEDEFLEWFAQVHREKEEQSKQHQE
jgi:hypothetical protein